MVLTNPWSDSKKAECKCPENEELLKSMEDLKHTVMNLEHVVMNHEHMLMSHDAYITNASKQIWYSFYKTLTYKYSNSSDFLSHYI